MPQPGHRAEQLLPVHIKNLRGQKNTLLPKSVYATRPVAINRASAGAGRDKSPLSRKGLDAIHLSPARADVKFFFCPGSLRAPGQFGGTIDTRLRVA
jgi:hypothetical protein